MRDDEEPGFKLIDSPQSASRAESAGLPAEGQEQLRRNGYVSQTWQPIESDDTAGMINVSLFGSEAGAREQLKWETSEAGIQSQIPDRLSAGAKAIHRRTNGECPCY